jgi:ankyrin repeat protein
MFKKQKHDDLIEAIEKGIYPDVRKHLDNGADVNSRYDKDLPHRKPLLSYAAMHGHTDIMKLLIERGAKVDKTDLHGRTPLSWAAEHCHFEAVKLLVEQGANVNAEDGEWTTPLAWLLYANDVNVKHGLQEYLMSKGARQMADHTFWHRLKYSLKTRRN